MAGILEIKRGVVSPLTLNDGEFYLNKGINAVQIGSGSSILTLLPLNQYVSGDIYLNGNIYANNLNISSSYASTSSFAYYAVTASYIISSSTSNTAISASHADTASYVLSSNVYGPWGFNSILTASYAVTASYAPGYLQTSATQSMLNQYLLISNTGSMLSQYVLNTQTSSFVTNNQTSSFATTTQLSSYVLNSQTSSFVTNNQTASFVTNSQTGSFILNSQTGSMLSPYLPNSQTSSFVTNNQTSSFVTNNQTASFVTNSQTSSMTVATASYVSSSNVYGPNGFNSILTASFALTTSFAVSSSYPFAVTGSTIYSYNSNIQLPDSYSVPTNNNIFIGDGTAITNGGIQSSVFMGYQSGLGSSNSQNIISLGEGAAQNIENVKSTIYLGYYAGQTATGSYAVYIGDYAGFDAYNSNNSVFIGQNTGRSALSASYSTLIGYNAGYRKTGNGIGQNNIIIGTNVTLANGRKDSINIGGIIFGTGSYFNTGSIPYSGSAGGYIGINEPYPTANLQVSGTIKFPNLQTGSTTYVVMWDSASGQLYYTASAAIGGSGSVSGSTNLSGGTNGYLALWTGSTALTISTLYQTGSLIGINTVTPNSTLDVSGTINVSDHLKIGTAPYPSYAWASGSRFDMINLITDAPTPNPSGVVAKFYSNYYGKTGFTQLNRWIGLQTLAAFEPSASRTYDLPANGWDDTKAGTTSTFGLGVSGSNGDLTTFNVGKSPMETVYGVLSKFDGWPDFDQGSNLKVYNGWYSTYGGYIDLYGASGSTMDQFSYYTAGGVKYLHNTTIDKFIGYYSHPLSQSGVTNAYSIYQSGSGDTNYFEGIMQFKNIPTGSYSNIILYDSQSGQLYYTASTAIDVNLSGGTDGYVPLWSGSTALTSSFLYQSESVLKSIYTGSDTGLKLDFSQSQFVLGDYADSGSKTKLTVDDTNKLIRLKAELTSSFIGDNNVTSWYFRNQYKGDPYYDSNFIGFYDQNNTAILYQQYWDSVFQSLYLGDANTLSASIQLYPGQINIVAYSPNAGYYYTGLRVYNNEQYQNRYTTIGDSDDAFNGNKIIVDDWNEIIKIQGNLSASADVYFGGLTKNGANSVILYDSGSGKLYYTSSNELGGKLSGGQSGYVALWNNTTTLTTSSIFQSGNNIGINTTNPTTDVEIAGKVLISSSLQSQLTLIGSGSTNPIFTVYGSQGELFSVTDNLSGSLFSVHDISGLPVIESFSDGTTLIGNYEAPALYTSVKKIINSGVGQVIYQIPTASYDSVYFDYNVRKDGNARAGQIMAIWSGSTVNYSEVTTPVFGNTSGFNLSVIITGSYIALTGSASNDGWVVKTIIRSI